MSTQEFPEPSLDVIVRKKDHQEVTERLEFESRSATSDLSKQWVAHLNRVLESIAMLIEKGYVPSPDELRKLKV